MTTGATDRAATRGRERSLWGPALLVLEVLVAYALVALVAGLIWEAVWVPPDQVVQQHQVYPADYEALRRIFTGTGLYVLIAAIASALTALVIGLLTRRRELIVLLSAPQSRPA
jgi:ABC-type Fe3+ transport system permease subunit